MPLKLPSILLISNGGTSGCSHRSAGLAVPATPAFDVARTATRTFPEVALEATV